MYSLRLYASLVISFIALTASFSTSSAVDLPCIPIPVRNCSGVTNNADLVAVYVQGCVAEPCTFTKGRSVRMEMDIRLKKSVESLRATLHAIVSGVVVRWDGLDPDVCKYIESDNDCPFTANEFITYGLDLNIQPSFPTVTADVRFTVADNTGETQVCWMVRASLVNP